MKEGSEMDDILNRPERTWTLGLSNRTANVLIACGAESKEDVKKYINAWHSLLKLTGVGPTVQRELLDWVAPKPGGDTAFRPPFGYGNPCNGYVENLATGEVEDACDVVLKMQKALDAIAPWLSAALSDEHCEEFAAAANSVLELTSDLAQGESLNERR